MPKLQKEFNFTGQVTLADGRVFAEAEWLSAKHEFTYQNNKSLVDEYARQADSNYYAVKKAERSFQRVEARRQQLQEQARIVQNELIGL